MDSATKDELRIELRAPLVVAAMAIVAVVILLLGFPSLGFFAALFLVVPLASLVLIGFLFRPGRGTKFAGLSILCCFVLLCWLLLKHGEPIRTETARSEVRWLIGSQSWKSKVLEEPPQTNSGMKCVIWDGWGMFAQDTDVYLVFSPDDGLRNYSPTNLNGLPSPVWHVQRLEKYWYSVTFYTEEGWDGCRYVS